MFLWVEVYKCKAGVCETNILPQVISLGGWSVGKKMKETT